MLRHVRAARTETAGAYTVDVDGKVLETYRADDDGGDGYISEIEILRGDLSRVLHDDTQDGVEYIFGIPGEENIDVMDALLDSPIKFVTTHHEQGAAFMADVYGRLTGRAGVCRMRVLGGSRFASANTRDSGFKVIVGTRSAEESPSRDQAKADDLAKALGGGARAPSGGSRSGSRHRCVAAVSRDAATAERDRAAKKDNTFCYHRDVRLSCERNL